MTGTDLYMFTHKSAPVIFEPPCTLQSIHNVVCELKIGYAVCLGVGGC
jgi:hypothetical protein